MPGPESKRGRARPGSGPPARGGGFDFAPTQFDGRELGRIREQVAQRCVCGCDRFMNARNLMGFEIIHPV